MVRILYALEPKQFMSLLILILEALGLLVVISIASELLAQGSEVLEKQLGSGFVGSVVLGFITMLPELIFVLVAVKAKELDVAFGSAIGGNILLFTIGYGLVILLAFYKHRQIITLPETMKDDLWYLLISALYLLIASLDGKFHLYDGVVLFSIYLVFVIHQFIEAHHVSKQRKQLEEFEEIALKEWLRSGLFLIVGGGIILVAAEPFVHVLVQLSVELNISALILALIISPLASEMPEKISAFVLTRRSMAGAEMAVANFVGSKVQGNTLLFGSMIIYAIATGAEFQVQDDMLEILLAVLTTIVGVKVTYDLKLNWKEGAVTLALYFVSLLLLIFVG